MQPGEFGPVVGRGVWPIIVVLCVIFTVAALVIETGHSDPRGEERRESLCAVARAEGVTDAAACD